MAIIGKAKARLQGKLQAARGIGKQDVKGFLKGNWPALLRMGIYATAAIGLTPDIAFANETVQITPLQKPLQVITQTLTGPIPILVTGGGVALGGMSWAMGWEQQAVMRGVKVAGGGAIAMAAGSFMESTIGDSAVTGLLFL